MTKVYCIRHKDYVQKALSENMISIDMIDNSATQQFIEFCKFKNPHILYNVTDFLFEISDEQDKIFTNKNFINLSQSIKAGWYYGKTHKSELQVFSATSSLKYQNIIDQNPNLIFTSFDRFREFYRPVKATNLLNGAFGLAYLSFKDDYDKLFRKIKVEKDQWIINWKDLELPEKIILVQLFSYHNAETEMLSNKVFVGPDLPLKMFSTVIERAMTYFLQNDYTMDDFLMKMSNSIQQEPGLKPTADELIELNEKYIKRGAPYDPKNPFAKIIKEFIDLGKTDTDKLDKIISLNELNPTSVFLVGMLNLGDRIDEILTFDHFIFAMVNLTMKHIVDITATESEVFISFDKKVIDKDRNNQFKYVAEYFDELRNLKKVTDKINDLSEKNSLFKKIYNQRENNFDLQTDIDDLTAKIEKLTEEEKSLTEEAKEQEKIRNAAKEYVEGVKKEKSQLEEEIDKIDLEIKTLEQKRNAKKLQSENLKKELDDKKSKETKDEEKEKKDKAPKVEDKSTKSNPRQKSKLPSADEMEEESKKNDQGK